MSRGTIFFLRVFGSERRKGRWWATQTGGEEGGWNELAGAKERRGPARARATPAPRGGGVGEPL